MQYLLGGNKKRGFNGTRKKSWRETGREVREGKKRGDKRKGWERQEERLKKGKKGGTPGREV